MTATPIVAYSVRLPDTDPGYAAYSDAYGLEMSFDNEWPIEAVIVTPETVVDQLPIDGLRDMGVSVGIRDAAASVSLESRLEWVVVELGRDPGSLASSSDTKRLVLVNSADSLMNLLKSSNTETQQVGAVSISLTVAELASNRLAMLRDQLDAAGRDKTRILLRLGSEDDFDESLVGRDNLDGVYVDSSSYEEMLEIMEAFAGR
ncbi:MAG: hypothetical protein AAFU85_17855 [Planctomycetota bacterium]